MHVEKWTFVLQTVNFAVLVWLLHRFLYRPVLAVIAARRAEIEKQYAQVAATQAQANAQLAAVEAERARMLSDREALLKDAASEADNAGAARHARAEREAAALIEAAHKSIAVERAEALSEVRRVALEMGCDIARQLLAEMPIGLRAEAWLERVEQHLAGLSPAERESLVRQSSNAPVQVVAAVSFPPESAATWRTRLRKLLGDQVVLDFSSNPALIAGVELHFPSAILRFTWQSTLAALREGPDAAPTSVNRPADTQYADAR